MKLLFAIIVLSSLVFGVLEKLKTQELESQILSIKAASDVESKKLNDKIASQLKTIADLQAERTVKSTEDVRYVVLKCNFSPGKLIENPLSDARVKGVGKDWKRIDPKWEIYVKGEQTNTEYPPLEVKEAAFNGFIAGQIITRSDLLQAKKN